MVNADIKPVVWLKRRQTKPGQLFRRGVKPSAVRTVTFSAAEKARIQAALESEFLINTRAKALAAARKAAK
jgi:hypothetical protein